MECSFPCYRFQDSMSSMMPTPSFSIDTIVTWWEHDDALHVDHFYNYLYCHLAPVDAP